MNLYPEKDSYIEHLNVYKTWGGTDDIPYIASVIKTNIFGTFVLLEQSRFYFASLKGIKKSPA